MAVQSHSLIWVSVWLCLVGCGDSLCVPQLDEGAEREELSHLSWPGWRGPDSTGVIQFSELPESWPEDAIEPAWQQPLGAGWSSPIVAAGRVFITDREGSDERLTSYDAATGRLLWQVTNEVDFEPHAVGRRHGNGPKATPATDGRYVYSLGIAGFLQCVDVASGERRWHRLLPAEFSQQVPLPGGRAYVNGTEHVVVPTGDGQGGTVPLFGYTGSPTLSDGKVILSVGGNLGATVMAFDALTGEVAWKSLNEAVSYSSPVVAEIAGRRQVVIMTGPRVVGLDVESGRLLWSHPFQIQYNESISTPAVSERYGLVMITGDSRPLTALRIAANDGVFEKEVAWQNFDLSSYLSSMVVVDDHVYGMADDGQFACVSLSDGATLWQGGNHGYYCSPVVAANRILGLNEKGGLLVLVRTAEGYREIGASQLTQGDTWTMPAVAGKRIYVRSAEGLACYKFD